MNQSILEEWGFHPAAATILEISLERVSHRSYARDCEWQCTLTSPTERHTAEGTMYQH